MIRLGAVLLILTAAVPPAPTCNIPVFRYALERWTAAPYEVIAFHRGPLDEEGRSALNVLRKAGANIEVDRLDVAEPLPPKRKALLEKLKLAAPCLVALYPGTETAAWSGPLNSESAGRLTDSPARREIAHRLLEGQSSVWVLLESGERAADDAAATVLETSLKTLEKTLKLPPHAPGDPALLSEVPVRVEFSVVRLSRQDAVEAPLVMMLMNSDTGLAGPVAFPIFGRGRALWAMAGKGLNPELIAEAGSFLVGACSCEAKELNPGVDLLFATDWEAKLASPEIRPAVPVPVLKPRPPEPGSPAPSAGSNAFLWGALLVAGLLVAITGRRVLSASKSRN